MAVEAFASTRKTSFRPTLKSSSKNNVALKASLVSEVANGYNALLESGLLLKGENIVNVVCGIDKDELLFVEEGSDALDG